MPKELNVTLCFDMDGTLADLYAVEGWLPMLRAFNPYPYANAKPMLNMSTFARLLHKAQRLGYRIEIVSWLSKEPNAEYDQAVTIAKLEWLRSHLPSVKFDKISIVPYGTPKSTLIENIENAILFDDEIGNRQEWQGINAFEPNEIFNYLRNLGKMSASEKYIAELESLLN